MDRIFSIANEDLERSNEEKTAAVHFLRFELDAASIRALKAGAALHMGIDHPRLPYSIEVPEANRNSLLEDLVDGNP